MIEMDQSSYIPSLERLALIKISITLWDKKYTYLTPDFLLMEKEAKEEKFEEIENKVSEKIQTLSIPEVLKEKIACIIKPIGREILGWIEDHEDLCSIDKSTSAQRYLRNTRQRDEVLTVPGELYWTAGGMVNRRKTAEALLKDENLDIKKRYVLACNYCFRKIILDLWDRMSDRDRKNFYSKRAPNKVEQPFLVVYWTYYVKGEVDRLEDTEPVDLFEMSLEEGYISATKYFFAKLNYTERKYVGRIIDDAISMSDSIDTPPTRLVWYLLSLMDEKTEREILEKHKVRLLSSLLNWPWQTLFLHMAERVRSKISRFKSCDLLHEIIDRVMKGYRDYDYQALFGEFWQQHSKSSLKFIVMIIADFEHDLLLKLLQIKDLDNFYLVLKEATVDQCFKIFLHSKTKVTHSLHKNDKFYSVPLLKQVFALSSSADIAEFVKEFKDRLLRGRSIVEIEKDKNKWNKFFQRINHHLLSTSRRSMDEIVSGAVKRRRIR